MKNLTEVDKKNLDRLHLMLTLGLLLIAAAMYYLIQSSGLMSYNYTSFPFIISSILVLLGILFGTKIYQVNINNAPNRNFKNYEEAMLNFRAANVVRWCTLLGTSLFASTIACIYSNPMILIAVLVGLFYLFVSKANVEHFNNYKY